MYFTDRGIEELVSRRGEETLTVAELAAALQHFVDAHPEHEIPIERFAVWFARDDEDED